MNESSSLVKVTILGQEYTVKAPANAEYIKGIAEYVNSKMKEVQENLGSDQSSTRIAILAAMNISDELFNIRRQKDSSTTDVEGRLLSLIELIDEHLDEEE